MIQTTNKFIEYLPLGYIFAYKIDMVPVVVSKDGPQRTIHPDTVACVVPSQIEPRPVC